MIDPAVPQRFLELRRIALVGASEDERSFAPTVQEALVAHGIEVVPVNPGWETVGGVPCYASLALVPGRVDGVMVMTPADRAADVVRDCAALGITKVWLFRGVGRGAVSDDAVALCHEHGIEVVEGACPLMFLEPVAWFHRVHRAVLHVRGSLGREHAA